VIKGLESAHTIAETTIFHAGTGVNDEGAIVNTGGRVLGVTALGENAQEAQSRAYEAVALIDWPEGFCRKDIGYHAVAAEEERNLRNTQASA
ncbi:MAG: phosphoribosylglycinamide synthetase C domain-containing protein, partial [Pseudomonadota bacterium]|nr:phosphoribosylglycinamide synthetase C domain-containing protein [Pseudomonadota bacterium]